MKNYIALGDLVLDVYYDKPTGLTSYYAGGSAWNDLLNISSLDAKAKCFCIATCGNDWAGDFILQKLQNEGIDTENVIRINKQTKRFNIIADENRTKSQLKCPVCNETSWYYDVSLIQTMPDRFASLSQGVVIIDNLKKSVLELAKSFRDNGWFLAVDIGYINHLRYLSADGINSLVCGAFEFVQMDDHVYRFFTKKFLCENESKLFERLKCKYLNITNGSNGAKFIYKDLSDNIQVVQTEAVKTKVVDETGAGDAYFSKLLQCLDGKGNMTADIGTALKEASVYAAERVAIFGANGRCEKIELPEGNCKVCGSKNKEKTIIRTPRQKIATNTNHLLERTLRALESEAKDRLQLVLSSLHGQILMIGTGGSFAAAVFASKCVTQYHPEATAYACYPRDVFIRGLNKITAVILFSYSGKTKDIKSVYDFCQKEGVRVYIITKYVSESTDNLYHNENIISYNASKSNTKERGFISMAGTLIPMCLFGEIYFKCAHNDFRAYLKECFERRSNELSTVHPLQKLPHRNLNIDIFSGADTSCSAIDLESKFIESGLARVTIHEKKDFSHGRFSIIEKYPPDIIVLLDNIRGAYSDKLFQYLRKRDTLNIYRLVSNHGNIWGDLDLVIASNFFSKYLSNILDYDMARPDYPNDAMTLYKYSRKDML